MSTPFWQNFSISTSHKPFLGSCEWPQKIGLDWLSRLDGHWILTNIKQAKMTCILYIEGV